MVLREWTIIPVKVIGFAELVKKKITSDVIGPGDGRGWISNVTAYRGQQQSEYRQELSSRIGKRSAERRLEGKGLSEEVLREKKSVMESCTNLNMRLAAINNKPASQELRAGHWRLEPMAVNRTGSGCWGRLGRMETELGRAQHWARKHQASIALVFLLPGPVIAPESCHCTYQNILNGVLSLMWRNRFLSCCVMFCLDCNQDDMKKRRMKLSNHY